MLEVAREGMNRSETPMSVALERLEFLRRRDEESVVLLLLELLLLLLLLLTAVLVLLKDVSRRAGGVAGKKKRPGDSLLLRLVSMERMGVGRKTIVGSQSRLSETGDLAVGVWK